MLIVINYLNPYNWDDDREYGPCMIKTTKNSTRLLSSNSSPSWHYRRLLRSGKYTRHEYCNCSSSDGFVNEGFCKFTCDHDPNCKGYDESYLNDYEEGAKTCTYSTTSSCQYHCRKVYEGNVGEVVPWGESCDFYIEKCIIKLSPIMNHNDRC